MEDLKPMFRYFIPLGPVLGILLLFLSPLSAEERGNFLPDPALARFQSAAEPLSVKEMIDAALLLSGTEQGELSGYESTLLSSVEQLKKDAASLKDDYEQGAFVLEYLHEKFLKRYREDQTRLDLLIKSGTYNCVSSAVLYMIHAKALGLPVAGVRTTDHAFCFVAVEGKEVDVETTNPYGWDPGTKKEFFDSFGHMTGYTYTPAQHYRSRTKLSEKEFLALILQNRISAAGLRHNFSAALRYAVDMQAFLNNKESEDLLYKAISNYAADLNSRGRYSEALAFLDKARALYGDPARFRQLLEVLVNNLVGEELSRKNFDEARSVVADHYQAGDITEQHKNSFLSVVNEQEVAYKIRVLDFKDAVRFLKERRAGLVAEQFDNTILYLYAKEADKRFKQQGVAAAIGLMEEARGLIGNHAKIDEAIGVYQYNFAVAVHNRVVVMLGQREGEKALQTIEEALKTVPDSAILLKDRTMIKAELEKRKTRD